MSWSWADEATRQAASLLPHLTCCVCLLARLQCYVILPILPTKSVPALSCLPVSCCRGGRSIMCVQKKSCLICQRDMEGAALGEHGRLGLGK
jgi:hypothetical protein